MKSSTINTQAHKTLLTQAQSARRSAATAAVVEPQQKLMRAGATVPTASTLLFIEPLPANQAAAVATVAASPMSSLVLPTLRYEYKAQDVKVRVGTRWKLQRSRRRTVFLRTGENPCLYISSPACHEHLPCEKGPSNSSCGSSSNSQSGLNLDDALQFMLVPDLTTCYESTTSSQALTLQSRRDDGKDRLRMRFASPAECTQWYRVILNTLSHARWLLYHEQLYWLSRTTMTMMHLPSKEEFVVKVLPNQRLNDACAELQVINKLSASTCSAQFVRGYRIVETSSDVQIVMPKDPGRTLLAFLQSRPAPHTLNEKETKAVLWQICQSLQALHALGIVHCDLKLENLMLNDVTQGVRVIDFGSAYDTNEPSIPGVTPNSLHRMVGTPGYIAPERILHVDTPPTSAADMFSLGILVFQMLIGKHPFPAAHNPPRALTLQDTLDPLDWTWMNAQMVTQEISSDAAQLLRQMLESDPRARISVSGVFAHRWFR